MSSTPLKHLHPLHANQTLALSFQKATQKKKNKLSTNLRFLSHLIFCHTVAVRVNILLLNRGQGSLGRSFKSEFTACFNLRKRFMTSTFKNAKCSSCFIGYVVCLFVFFKDPFLANSILCQLTELPSASPLGAQCCGFYCAVSLAAQ